MAAKSQDTPDQKKSSQQGDKSKKDRSVRMLRQKAPGSPLIANMAETKKMAQYRYIVAKGDLPDHQSFTYLIDGKENKSENKYRC